ncbi:MAG: alpha-(1-_3)-arabinofuranosyltransferase [Actinomycetota bacterium]|nr:alpha-(1->3)-arabinofuranosyltransferase [Actinomycetota bacterium]
MKTLRVRDVMGERPAMAREFLARRRLTLIFAGLAALVVVAVFANSWGSFTPDTEPQLYYAPGRTLIQSLFAWKASPFLGQGNFQTGLAPVAAAIYVIRALGASPWVAVRIWRALLLILAGWGAAKFYDRLAGDRGRPVGRIAAAVLYVANPYVIVSGASTPVLLPYALFPWMMLAFSRSVDRPRSWKWPAAFALAFFLMGGLNAGIVNVFLLLGVPAYVLYARLGEGIRFRQTVRPLIRCGVLLGLSSAYWIVPALAARGTGSSIAFATEKPADVASTSSYAETARLLGLWPLYGRQGALPFLPNAVGYITNAAVVLTTFAIPVAAAVGAVLSRSRARVMAAMLIAIGAPVMVGLFPPASPTPFGRALQAFFDRFPGGIGFRTTNKVGALVALGLTLLIALGAAEAVLRMRGKSWVGQGLLAGVSLVVLLGAVFPAWTGTLYQSGWKQIPGYWDQAAAALNAGSPTTRALFLPGEEFADYRWGKRGPADLNDSLLSRPSALRVTVPGGSAYAADFLAALDQPLESGAYTKGSLSTMARYLGVRDVLVRNDMKWEEWGGARPSQVAAILGQEGGVRLAASYGAPGENTVAPGPPGGAGTARARDEALPSLQRYVVAGPRPVVRAEAAPGTVLVDGDNFGLAHLPQLGLLPGDPAFRLLGVMTSSDLEQAVTDGAQVVLTDSNRRRAWNFRRTGVDYSATLGPQQTLHPGGDLSFRLFGNSSDTQSVAILDGATSIQATNYGSVFGPVPSSQPYFAFDGDPHSAWLAAGFGGAVGQAISIHLPQPVSVSDLTLTPVLGGGRQISSVRLALGPTILSVPIPPGQEVVTVPVSPAVLVSSLNVQITGIRGQGLNPVGFWEIGIPGVTVRQFIRLPLTFSQLAAGLDSAGKLRLSKTPLDVVMVRDAGSPTTTTDDEERNLYRQFTLPQARNFTFDAVGTLKAELSDSALDHLIGVPPSIVAESSSRVSPGTRASQALDGNPDTAWSPNGKPVGQFIDVSFPAQTLSSIVVEQPDDPTGKFISKAYLSINGTASIPEALGPGSTTIHFPRQEVHDIRLTIRKVGGLAGFIKVSELGIGALQVAPTDATTPLQGCVPALLIDQRRIRVHLPGTLGRLLAGLPFPLEPCGSSRLRLEAGVHRIQPVADWQIDSLHLASPPTPSVTPPGLAPKVPVLEVQSQTPSRMTITTRGARPAEPYYLVIGQGYDPRWHASMDGQLLGQPILVDGYSAAWIIRSPGPHAFVVWFGPQRFMNLSLAVSLMAIVLLVVLLFRKEPRTRSGA